MSGQLQTWQKVNKFIKGKVTQLLKKNYGFANESQICGHKYGKFPFWKKSSVTWLTPFHKKEKEVPGIVNKRPHVKIPHVNR